MQSISAIVAVAASLGTAGLLLVPSPTNLRSVSTIIWLSLFAASIAAGALGLLPPVHWSLAALSAAVFVIALAARRPATSSRRTPASGEAHDALFSALMGQGYLCVYAMDVETRSIIEANRALANLLGYTSAELLRMSVYSFVDHAAYDIDDKLREVRQGSSMFLGERHYLCKDGTSIPMEVTASAAKHGGRDVLLVFAKDMRVAKRAEEERRKILDELEARVEERTAALAAANRDLRRENAERQRAETALKDTEDVLQAILHSSSAAIAVLDRQANVTMWNRGAELLFGYAEDEVLGRPYPLVSESEWDGFYEEYVDGIESEIVFSGCEVRHAAKDGTLLDLDLSVAPLRSPEGKPIGEMRVFMDITRLTALEDALEFRGRFDELITAFSSELVSTSPADVDRRIVEALGRLGGLLQVRDIRLDVLPSGGRGLARAFVWRSTPDEPLPDVPSYAIECFRDSLRRGETIRTKSVADFPPWADHLRECFRVRGIGGFLAVPIMCGDELLGCVEVGSATEGQTWPTDVQPLLTVIGEIIVSSLARKETEAEIVRQHDFLRMVIDTDPNFIFVKDRDGRYVLANRATAEAYGTTVENMVGKTDRDFHFTREESERYHADDVQVMQTGRELFVQEELNTDAAGNRRWLQTIKCPIVNGNRPVDRVLGIITDITAFKQMEEAYRESTERYKNLYNNAVVGLGRFAVPEGRMIECNQHLATMLGWPSPEELIAAHTLQPDAIGSFAERLRAFPAVSDVDLHLRRRDGERIWVRVSYHRTDDGRFVDLVATDVTDEKHAEQERLKLATAIEQVAELVGIATMDGEIEYVNPAFEQAMGYAPGSARGLGVFRLAAERSERRTYVEILRTIRGGRDWKGQINLRSPGGAPVRLECTASPLRDEEGNIVSFIVVARDITRQSQLEEQLRQAQKMEAVGRLAGGVAHDFNNLLTGILGNLQLVQMSLPDSEEEITSCVDGAIHTAERAADLTRRLLTFSRKAIVTPEVVDLNAAIENARKMLERLISENIRLDTVLDSDPPYVRIDRAQLEQVILNLVVNARDAMPEGGKLTVQAMKVLVEADFASQEPGMHAGPYCMLSVCDTGHGMDAQTLEHLYEPFFTRKGEAGTGLGLATVYSIVRQNDGHITCASQVGQGTTFRVYFPEAPPPVGVITTKHVRHAATGGHEKILVVEDEASILATAVNVLRKNGYQVTQAGSAEEAMDVLGQMDDGLDLLLTDVILPGKSGRELADEVARIHPDTGILFTSGYTDDVIARHGILEPGVNFLEKPYSLTGLLSSVREVLDAARTNKA